MAAAPPSSLLPSNALFQTNRLIPTSQSKLFHNNKQKQTFIFFPRLQHNIITNAQNNEKPNPWLDPFDDGEDTEYDYQGLYAEGKQEEDPTPPVNPDSPYGFLKFPMGYTVEIASLASKVRGDVRRCCCIISGGVYENLLFFPVIQLIKDRYPGVQIDVVSGERGKQAYEMNKNVRWANVYDPDDDWPEPAEYTDMLGVLKGRYYDMVLSTKLGGLGHAAFLYMTTARDRVSYIYPNVNSAGAGLLLSQTFKPDSMNLVRGWILHYRQMSDWLGRPARKVERHDVKPLKVAISKKVKDVVEKKYKAAGVEKGIFVVIHGIECDSKASMQSRGDTDSLLPIQVWTEIVSEMRGLKPVFVIPHEKIRDDVEQIAGDDASIVFITTPGQLAALINDSIGVIANQHGRCSACYRSWQTEVGIVLCRKCERKAELFVPNIEESRCITIASSTGKLADIDVKSVKNATQVFDLSFAFL
ncbi:unnamed protein product [Rhodiola kirilowii]